MIRGLGTVHVVGAGLAGLAAAVRIAVEGGGVRLYEAGLHAGGRCRSYLDAELGCRIDNGNHLLLAGNHRALGYLERIGALDTLEGPSDAAFPFVDAKTGRRWTLRPNRGVLPWWILSAKRRVPGTRAADYLAVLALRRADPSTTVVEALDGDQEVFRCLWEPLAVAALNTCADRASARLFWRILAETLGCGGEACRPLVPRDGLSETFVDPALARLRAQGAEICFGARLRAVHFALDHVTELEFDTGPVGLGRGDSLILAVPAAVAARLVPALTVPDVYSPIVNAHFRCAVPASSPYFVGMIGGNAEWIFRKREGLSTTVSAADTVVDRPAEELRDLLWRDAALAYQLPPHPVPPGRIVKERRATFLASPAQLLRRPGPTTRWKNLLLAGDYVDTGLPAAIEGAIASGFTAARRAFEVAGAPLRSDRHWATRVTSKTSENGSAPFHE
ncbi:MAG: FAD-dependent oxidoreductase [Alphaproteobacteria bacterium]|nr:FAD-dependent oxidoreductase [Alphaproteobacteria bacterium]